MTLSSVNSRSFGTPSAIETTKRSLLNITKGVSDHMPKYEKGKAAHRGCEFSSPQLLICRDLRSLRFRNEGMIVLAGDPMKCKERYSTLSAKDRMSSRALVWSMGPLRTGDGFRQRDRDRI